MKEAAKPEPEGDDNSSEMNDVNVQTELNQPDLDVDTKVTAAESEPSVVTPSNSIKSLV